MHALAERVREEESKLQAFFDKKFQERNLYPTEYPQKPYYENNPVQPPAQPPAAQPPAAAQAPAAQPQPFIQPAFPLVQPEQPPPPLQILPLQIDGGELGPLRQLQNVLERDSKAPLRIKEVPVQKIVSEEFRPVYEKLVKTFARLENLALSTMHVLFFNFRLAITGQPERLKRPKLSFSQPENDYRQRLIEALDTTRKMFPKTPEFIWKQSLFNKELALIRSYSPQSWEASLAKAAAEIKSKLDFIPQNPAPSEEPDQELLHFLKLENYAKLVADCQEPKWATEQMIVMASKIKGICIDSQRKFMAKERLYNDQVQHELTKLHTKQYELTLKINGSDMDRIHNLVRASEWLEALYKINNLIEKVFNKIEL